MSDSRPVILFAHGAGAGSSSEWMMAWARRLGDLGHVRPFDYPYMQRGSKAPDRLPKLIEAHRVQLAEVRAAHPGQPVVLAGKSMGSRVGCHLALEEEVAGLICLGYPLKGMGKSGKVRDEVLVALRTPVLFVQGTRDTMGPLDLFESVRGRMRARNELHVVETGNHSLIITKTHTRQTGVTQDQSDAAILDAVGGFMESVRS